MSERRIVSEPSWRVQAMFKGEWITAAYCGSEASANRALAKMEQREEEWAKMTQEERMRSILRES
jgi:acyl-CoA reductase-like NAD-dependent aldehyde dehydrogenase